MATFVLGQALAWRDPALVTRAIDQLAIVAGDRAPRVRLARATLLYRVAGRSEAQLAEAIVLTDSVLAESPESLSALALKATLLLEGDAPDPARAVDNLERAVRLYPRQLELYPRLIELHQRRGDYPGAEPLLDRLGELVGRNRALIDTELRLLQVQGDFDRAVLRLSEFVDSSSSGQEQLRLAQLNERAGRLDEAAAIYARLVESGAGADVAIVAADFHAGQGRLEEAHRILDRAALGDHGASLRLRGMLLRRHGQLDAAAPLLEEAVALDPEDAEAWSELARLRLARADFAGARSAAEAGLALAPSDASLESIVQVASLELPDEAARREAVEALGEPGRDPAALRETLLLYQRGASRREGPSSRDRLDSSELARRLRGFLPAWKMSVTWLTRAGQVNEAVRVADEAATLVPGRPEPAEWATRLLLKAGRDEDALAMAYSWRERMRHRPYVADMLIAALELTHGRAQQALLHLTGHETRIVAEREARPERASVLLGALLHDGQVARASRLLDELVGTEGAASAGAVPWLGAWLDWSAKAPPDHAASALEAIEPLVRREGGGGEPGALRLASAWTDLSERSGGAAHLANAERLAGELTIGPAVLNLQARLAGARGDHAGAESCYRRALAIDPDDVDVLNNLAWMLAQRGAVDEAADLAEHAAALAPADADVLDTWATALMGADRLDEAEQAARRARTIRSEDPALGLTLSKVLVSQGNLDGAEAELTRTELQIAARPPAERRSLEPEVTALRAKVKEARLTPPRKHAAIAP